MDKTLELSLKIKSKEDFLVFFESLLKDHKNGKNWENNTLESYLEGFYGAVHDMDGFYLNMKQPVPENINWNFIAHLLISATLYE